MTPTPTDLAARYFAAWKDGDADTLRSLLADDVSFVGPLASVGGVDACVAGLQGMLRIVDDIVVLARVSDDHDVITWFELHTSVAPPTSTANWSHVEDGRITAIRVAFDPREIIAGSKGPSS